MNGALFQIATSAKCLGFTFDSKLTWVNHRSDIRTKIWRRTNYAGKLTGKTSVATADNIIKIYKTYISPVNNYAAPAWINLTTSVFLSSFSLQRGIQKEIKETYGIVNSECIFPSDQDTPGFKETCLDFLEACVNLCRRFLVVLALSLDLAEDFFLKRHQELTKCKENASTLKLLYYPPVTDVTWLTTTVRCGEHFVFGTVTFLFQDNVGGLEVKTKSGEWIPATPLGGAILVNVGEFLEMWSEGVYSLTCYHLHLLHNS
ncbi:uncharacterized protein LOC143243710 [Tachypleus tridentatus]|uniref:uncharacterized protein LOC143243710 n=1 Tax=Tachypleus tridentatus TaxID=6853 RepID=UPI003FD16928